MRLKLKYKIFIILFAASIVIITCMFLFTRMSFEHGFLSYVDQMEMKRLHTMGTILEEAYGNEGSWHFLENNPQDWYRLQKYTFRKWRNKRHRSHRHESFQERRPPSGAELDGNRGRGWMRGSGNDDTCSHRKKCSNIVLLNKDKDPIFGLMENADNARLTPIKHRDETVGWLGYIPPEFISEGDELLFFKKQSRMFLLIFVVMVILSVIMAIWIAYYLEGPIGDLTKGTRKLASGKYDVRIPVKSDDELGELSRDFNSLARTLEENEKSRKQWVADIAHELRTPLTLLSGELEAVQDGVRELTPDTLKLLHRDIKHLIRLVNDLGELSRTDLGALSYKKEDIDLLKVFQQAVDRFREELSEGGLNLEDSTVSEKPVMVFADSERMSQLFGNVFQNTLNYTHSGGQVKIWIDRSKENVVFNIQDSEPGVPDKALPKLFERLFRVEPSRNKTLGGTGLGLAICKNIAEAHEGKISASRSPLGGLWIQVELPSVT